MLYRLVSTFGSEIGFSTGFAIVEALYTTNAIEGFNRQLRKVTKTYTTNAIEGFNRQLRKVTKTKSVFPTDDSLLKMLYLAMMDITKKWTGHRQDWSLIHTQMAVFFAERMPE